MDPDFIHDLLASVGPLRLRRMFGGTGIYAGGRMFALEAGGVLHLKADASTVPEFQREGCEPFTYQRADGRRTSLSYWTLPEHLLDSPEDAAPWAQAALAAAERAAAAKPSPRPPRPRSGPGTPLRRPPS